MIEPIPFAGWVYVDDDIQETLQALTGSDPKNMPKYIVLGDGAVYFYHKEEQRYALCEQTPPLQEGI
jgi:hypothetical protein